MIGLNSEDPGMPISKQPMCPFFAFHSSSNVGVIDENDKEGGQVLWVKINRKKNHYTRIFRCRTHCLSPRSYFYSVEHLLDVYILVPGKIFVCKICSQDTSSFGIWNLEFEISRTSQDLFDSGLSGLESGDLFARDVST